MKSANVVIIGGSAAGVPATASPISYQLVNAAEAAIANSWKLPKVW